MFDKSYQILLIDDDPDILASYQDLLEQEGYVVLAIDNPQHIVEKIPENWEGLILCDVMLPHISGLEILKQIMQRDDNLPVIMITGHGDVPMAVNAVKMGATNFLEKPVSLENLLIQVKNALSKRQHFIQQKTLQLNKLQQEFIGGSEWISTLRQQLQKLANSQLPVFLWGENGTGRYLSARNLHQLSQRQAQPLVFYECTGTAAHSIQSLISQSENSTLVIKHLHLLSLQEQQELALALHNQEKNIRLIAISDEPLLQLIRNHHLSSELYAFFIHTQIELLPLHKHPSDIAAIFLHYLEKSSLQLHKSYTPPSKKLLQHLCHQQWVGNVTELISVAELYAIGLFAEPTATTLANNQIKAENPNSLEDQINQYEKQIIEDALIFFQGRINEAANYLQIPRKKLYLRMQKYGIDKKEYKLSN